VLHLSPVATQEQRNNIPVSELGLCHNCGAMTGKNAWRGWTRGGWVDACALCFWEKYPTRANPGVRGPLLRGEVRR
jgi:hypothetical protein